MKLTINGGILTKLLADAVRALPSGRDTPAAECVLLDAEPGRLSVTATDGVLTKRVSSRAAVVAEAGRVLAPGKALYAMARAMDGEVAMKVSDSHRIQLQCGGARLGLAGLDPVLFPAVDIETAGSPASIGMPQAVLREMLSKVLPAVAADDVREVLKSVKLEIARGKIQVTGCDGFRLARVTRLCPESIDACALVPGRAAAEFVRALTGDEACTIAIDDRKLVCDVRDAVIATKLAEGQYADCDRIIPGSYASRCTLDAERLAAAAERAACVGGGAHAAVLELAGESLTIKSSSAEAESVETIDVMHEGTDITIKINLRYLQDALRTMSGAADIFFTSSVTPVTITAENDRDCLQLMLPIRMSAQ